MARALRAPEDLRIPWHRSLSLVIRANEFLLLDQFFHNLLVEPRESLRISLAKSFKLAMPTPEIPHSIPPIALGLTLHFRCDVASSLLQKPGPDSLSPKNVYKLNSLTLANPEPAVDDEPRRCDSLRRPLHFRDDFLCDGTRSLLIARKVH
jgi:hypothetical protein